jgi:UDP-N-acetylglucosamine--N-acetylmuramyl-(pentapeptide) pyrophosphoryl-undecaprenol N-acetylglucosamine transferase
LGLPALVVPISEVADDHQLANARAFANRTGTAWTREVDWSETAMAESLARALGNADAWTMAAARMRAAARPDAASAVVDACERLAGRLRGGTPDALKAASTRSARR